MSLSRQLNPFRVNAPRTVGGPVLDWLTGNDEEIRRGEDLDARLKALNQALYEKGKISAAQLSQMNGRIDAGGADTYSAQVEQGFYDGMVEGYSTMAAAVKDTAGAGVDTIKAALNAPVTAFKAALNAAGKAATAITIMQLVFTAGAIYLGYRFLKSDTGRKAARAYVTKRL